MRINPESNEVLLAYYCEILSHLKEMLNQDIMVVITDKTHVIQYYPGDKLAIKENIVGNELKAEDTLLVTMNNGRTMSSLIDGKLFGIPFISINYPIKNLAGEVIGCVGIGRSLEKEHIIEEISQSLAATLEEVNASLQEVAAGSQGLSQTMNQVVDSVNKSFDRIKEINKVISAITDISSHSHLLGLNAAIEAARAGEHGRGFAVVAEEMRKLATQSKESANIVTQMLTEMKNSIESIISDVNQVGNIAEAQAVATEQITAAIGEIGDNSKQLADFAKLD